MIITNNHNEKMEILNILVRYTFLYLVILSGSIFISYKFNKKIEKCIAPAMSIIIIVLYIFGMFEGLKYGIWAILVAYIILGIYGLKNGIKNKEKLKENLLTPGLVFFTIVFFILAITTYSKNLVDYDHFFYRSVNTKIMYYTDTMSRGFDALYPPASNLIEYFFMKIAGEYVQGIEAFAIQIFGISLLIPLFERKNKSKLTNIVIATAIICLPAIFPNLRFYESAYPDALLGLLIGYSAYTLCTEKDNKFKVISVLLSLVIITITKPIGFVIAGIIIAMYLITELINMVISKQGLKKFLKSVEFRNIVILTIMVLVTLFSWKAFTKINNKHNYGVRGTTVSRVIESSTKGSSVEGSSVEYTLKAILTTTLGYSEGDYDAANSIGTLIKKMNSTYACTVPVIMSIYGTIVLLIIASLILYKYVINKENKKKFSYWIAAFAVGTILYILALQLGYILKFSTAEMLGHNGFDRYMPTFLLAITYFIVGSALKNMAEKGERKVNYVILIAVIMLFTNFQSISDASLTSGIYNINSIQYCNTGRIPADNIRKKIGENDKIISISQDRRTDIYNWMIKYYLCPDYKVNIYNGINVQEVRNIKNLILNNDSVSHIYIVSYNEDLEQYINDIFENDVKLENNTWYKIQVQDEKIELIEE